MVKAYFLDSSALVKQYVSEIGSSWIQSISTPQAGNHLVIARVAWVEVLSALARLQRESKLSATDITTTIHIFRHDWDTQYQVVEIDLALTFAAGHLVQQYPLRAYHSIQLAAVLRLKPIFAQFRFGQLIFISADLRLLAVAQAEGIATDDPNLHP